jgi:hypothetical protein
VRVGILGTRWGRTHVGTFRAAGCEIWAIVGQDPERSREVARAEGVPHAEPEALEDADIVVIATPAETHAELVSRWAHKILWCEKPLMAQPSARLWVNYAFPFLPATEHLRGEPVSVHVAAGEGGAWALREVAVHPMSWVYHVLGRTTSLSLAPSAEGITISMAGLEARLCGDQWTYTVDGAPVAGSWYEANVACVRAFVEHLRGGARDPRLFDGVRAQQFEQALGAWAGDGDLHDTLTAHGPVHPHPDAQAHPRVRSP